MKSLIKNFPSLQEAPKLPEKAKSNDINSFIIQFNEKIETLVNQVISDEQINSKEYVKSQLVSLDKLKVPELKALVKQVNSLLKNDVAINEKQKKKDFVNALLDSLFNTDNLMLKKTLFYILNGNENLSGGEKFKPIRYHK